MKRSALALLGSLLAGALAQSTPGGGGSAPPQANSVVSDRPFLAIWHDRGGNAPGPQVPYLRAAFWDDGRVLFSLERAKWGPDLQQGRISQYRVERLRAALRRTGVFQLKGHCYLAPDMGVDCVMVDLGKEKQMLYWVEGMTRWMDAPHRQEFVKSWTLVNDLASVACPDRYEPVKGVFKQPPESWYVKPKIQSE